ncbi:hypothetical protein FDH66_gp30 [Arthrobacter phage Amigo]|uniref:Uncharacterized protein n=5 Tax=Amigovirus amigo TaxID=1982100 RepID=A0A5J6TBV0_9CAUD|nr:hypothetical protein FDH66_gp30 [Arthrobacter phage Amigo]QFG08366.1 hypothetical protein SEA_YEEZUS_74 [Arthrobacter phage Yeezus]QFG13415.1 hypothetical protein SEA_ICHOR_74 [Arthrobacter phage Ichor]QFG13933.1 hypothetical protein SEA_JAEK_74 [Arthrobacter phage Jaek]QJD51720.1 hypothetical protein SEA_BOERSMA_77 [Arthrobacter phage Boersma]ALY08421.1 hypothetical protein AMIGO_75 [Arthrobacter phage Amigo]
MEWIWDLVNSLGLVGLGIWAHVGFRRLSSENDQRKANIRHVQAKANEAHLIAVEAKRAARKAKQDIDLLTRDGEPDTDKVAKLPETPRNERLVKTLREISARQRSKKAHPAGTGRQNLKHKNPTTQAALHNPSYDYLPVAAVIAATDFGSSSSSSSYDSGSSSSYSSSDSGGSFSGGDSGSF